MQRRSGKEASLFTSLFLFLPLHLSGVLSSGFRRFKLVWVTDGLIRYRHGTHTDIQTQTYIYTYIGIADGAMVWCFFCKATCLCSMHLLVLLEVY
jgi:hypothetical protein